MAGINSVCVVGNLTHDPELREAGSTSVCDLRIAVNEREKRDGEWTDRASYFTVTVWGNQAESCAKYLMKGKPIAVQGRLRWEQWEDKESGGKRQTVKIVAHSVQFLYGKDGGGGGGNGSASSAEAAPASKDDIPF